MLLWWSVIERLTICLALHPSFLELCSRVGVNSTSILPLASTGHISSIVLCSGVTLKASRSPGLVLLGPRSLPLGAARPGLLWSFFFSGQSPYGGERTTPPHPHLQSGEWLLTGSASVSHVPSIPEVSSFNLPRATGSSERGWNSDSEGRYDDSELVSFKTDSLFVNVITRLISRIFS